MSFTKKQLKDLETIEYFIPSWCNYPKPTDKDKKMLLENSERGKHKDKIDERKINGFNALIQGKKWRGVHMGMYEEGVLDGSMPYYIILGGYDDITPMSVVDFMKREMFKGIDSELIEKIYQNILKNNE